MRAAADEEDDEWLCGPVPCEWESVTEQPSDDRIVLLATAPSPATDGHEGVFMGRFRDGQLRFLDRRVETSPTRPVIVAWTDFPPSPPWLKAEGSRR